MLAATVSDAAATIMDQPRIRRCCCFGFGIVIILDLPFVAVNRGVSTCTDKCKINASSYPAALLQIAERQVQAMADQRDHFIDLRTRHHQRRRDDHAVADGAHDHAVVEHVAAADHTHGERFVEADVVVHHAGFHAHQIEAGDETQLFAKPTSGWSASVAKRSFKYGPVSVATRCTRFSSSMMRIFSSAAAHATGWPE